jgi:methionyl-tRNA synthetase
MANILITSALPYINGVKHLGNLAGSLLPADIQARHRRQIGDEVLFICATDEHGTPAELAAAEAGIEVAAYCASQHEIQADIYRRFHLDFDHFGRTSSARNQALTQHFFERLEAEGFIEERIIEQVYSPADRRFLPDRYIIGTCPHCGFAGARGDQCESCTRPLDPVELIEPRSALSGDTQLEIRESRHLFLRQSALAGELDEWILGRSGWPPLVTSIARKWLTEGLKDRCITRDLAWGVKVPRPGFEQKVFYVWFDAPIGYIAATQEWADADPARRDWRSWWWDAKDVTYLQFLGKDNVPFHAVSFPCTLIGSREPWTRVDVIKGVNWLTYEGGKFSTSRRRGVFLDQALELLPADRWRWWLAANAPEGNDADFSFGAFATQVNHDLADSFGNLVNRVIRFVEARHHGVVPQGGLAGEAELRLAAELDRQLAALRGHHGACALRKAAQELAATWRLANVYLAAQAPWTLIERDPARAALVIRTGVNLVDVAARLAWPFIPSAAAQVLAALGEADRVPPFPQSGAEALSRIPAGRRLGPLPVLFDKLAADWVEACEQRFAGEG